MQSIWRKNVRRDSQVSSKFRKLLQRDINHLEQKIKNLEKTFKFLDEEFVSNMMKAEEKKWHKLCSEKGNALKRKSTEKKAEIRSLEESLMALQEIRKKL